jgi:hypothetical protein
MIDEHLARLRAHRANVHRYRRLLATRLSDLERAYIERRLKEEQAAMEAHLQATFPDRLALRMDRGRTTDQEIAALLHPAEAFGHPMDVVEDGDLTTYEKRAILSSWAADACAVPELNRAPGGAVDFDDILDALRALESEVAEVEEETDADDEPGRDAETHDSGHTRSL